VKTPFDFVALPPERTMEKPRAQGLTMMVDFGVPPRWLDDQLAAFGAYVDLGKVAVGTARLYRPEILAEKLSVYRSHGVRSFIGGQFYEMVYHHHGEERLDAFMQEAKRLGFDAVEISDNVVALDDEARARQISRAVGHGLAAFGEVGSKGDKTDPDLLVHQAKVSFEAGAERVLVEGAELVENGSPKEDVLAELSARLDLSRLIIELPGPWVGGTTTAQAHDLKKALIRRFGPDVNLGNVTPDLVLETESLRVGLGVSGPSG
jgi:phosphosulfolactate synthase